jgi:hypothetical protein
VEKGCSLHLMNPTATPADNQKSRKPAICCMLTKLFNSIWGQFQRHIVKLQPLLHTPNKQTGTLVIIILVLVVGILREPIELTINSCYLGSGEFWSHSLCHKPSNHGMTIATLCFVSQTNRQEAFPSSWSWLVWRESQLSR